MAKVNLSDFERAKLEEFSKAVESMLSGYGHASFSYLAIRQGGDFVLVQGLLHLLGVPLQVSKGHFESENVKAGNFDLIKSDKLPKEILSLLSEGKLVTPNGNLVFTPDQNNSYSIYFNPLHVDAIQAQRRQMQLVITGGARPQPHTAKIDWELKAAIVPFDSVQELCDEYGVGPMVGNQVCVEVAAHNLAAIEIGSVIKGARAFLGILLVDGLDPKKASIGYRLLDKNKVIKRSQIPGANMNWSRKGDAQYGCIELDVPSGALLHCVANYENSAHHHYWVRDPAITQNPRRGVHLAFDQNMEMLHELLNSHGKGRDARAFEKPIAWILWMLGFNVSHIGGSSKTSDAPDLIATTPMGHFIVIECTTGLLKAENKLAKLVERTEKVRQSLASSGNGHCKVLPAIVTNKSREEIKAELEQAETLGVLVETRDGFADLINLTHIPPNPDYLYKELEERVRAAQNRSSLEV